MKKQDYWQMIKGICIVLVVLIHTLYFTGIIEFDYTNIVIRRIINFAVAVFIFISGYFTNYTSIREFYKKKVNRIVIPLVLWDLIYTALVLLTDNVNFWDSVKMFLTSSSSGHLYYLYVLIQLFLIAPLLNKYLKNTESKKTKYLPILITPIYCCFLVGYYILFNKPFILYNYWLFGWISYYYLGMLVKTESLNFNNKRIILILCLTLVMTVISGIELYYNTGFYSLAISQLTLFNSIYSLVICIFIVSLKNIKVRKNIFVRLGSYSFGIYLSHMLVIKAIKKISEDVAVNYCLEAILIFTITLTIEFLVCYLYYEKVRRML